MGLKVPVIYDTLSDLKNDTNVVGGMIVKTLGEEAIGDGKGHTYKVYDPSMGKPYDRTKHIPLSKQDVFAEIVEDNPLYSKIGSMQEEIDELKQSGQAIDTTNFLHTYSTVASMQADTSLRVGITCKTLGEETLGDGKGRTYKIYEYDIEHGLHDDQISMANTSIVAQVIVDSIAESRSASNAENISELSEVVTEGFAAVNDTITSTYSTLKEAVETGYMRVYDTYNDFISAEDIAAGMTVRTLGKDMIGDGNGKTYKVWNENSGHPYDPDVNIDLAIEGYFAEEFEENVIYQQVRDNTFNIEQMTQSVETIEGQVNDLTSNVSNLTDDLNSLSINVANEISGINDKIDSPYLSNTINAFNTAGVAIRKLTNGTKDIIVKAWPEDAEPTGEEQTETGYGYEIVYTDESVIVKIRLDTLSSFGVSALSYLTEGEHLTLTDNIYAESYHEDEPVPDPEPEPEPEPEPDDGDGGETDPVVDDSTSGDTEPATDGDNTDETDPDASETIRVNYVIFNITRTNKNVIVSYV